MSPSRSMAEDAVNCPSPFQSIAKLYVGRPLEEHRSHGPLVVTVLAPFAAKAMLATPATAVATAALFAGLRARVIPTDPYVEVLLAVVVRCVWSPAARSRFESYSAMDGAVDTPYASLTLATSVPTESVKVRLLSETEPRNESIQSFGEAVVTCGWANAAAVEVVVDPWISSTG